MKPRDYQLLGAVDGYKILRQYGIVYYAWEERCGKSLTALALCEMTKASRILIVTKKKAMQGWLDTLEKFEHLKSYEVINYHSVHKTVGDYDLIILDEAHSYIATLPKPGKLWKMLYPITKDKPIIYLSATPYPENLGQLYNQFRLTKYTPFKYKNFYDFFRDVGVPSKTRTPYGLVETYSKYKDEKILAKCEHLFLYKTRKDLGFEHEPEDILHYYKQADSITTLQKEMLKTEMFRPFKPVDIPLDSPMKARTVAYQLEGGWVKDAQLGCISIPYKDRIKAIQADFGDGENCAIMSHFTCEQEKLKDYFPKAMILSSTSHSEGIDLSHIDNLIIYSMDFSTGRFQQRRARQANYLRDTPIKVHYYFAKGSVSEAVYQTVAKKRTNFLKNSFERWAEGLE